MKRLIIATAGALCAAASAQVATFDVATNLVTIPSVQVDTSTYGPVTLRHLGDYKFVLQDANFLPISPTGSSTYDIPTGRLLMPAVKVGSDTYIDVVLRDTGNFNFELESAQVPTAATLAGVADMIARYEALYAVQTPASGAEFLQLGDACWRDNGRTKAFVTADYDANLAAFRQRDAYQVGRRVANVQILGVRDSANDDGSRRTEVQLQYDVNYRDGSSARQLRSTLVSGNSSGSCATPQDSPTFRFLGNQQLVQTNVRARNWRDERYSINTGAALATAVNYRREVNFNIVDEMGNATYVIVTGPGPSNSTTVPGQVLPFSLKFISPRLLMNAPELQGKPGHYLNWQKEDAFRNCRLASGALPAAGIVDCVAGGATSAEWGWTTPTPDASADAGFAAQGWVAGGIYRFEVYNDDGWKTVNGHVGRKPIGTYHDTLDRLPYTFVEMNTRYPRINLGNLSTAQLAANARSATPAPLALSWTPPGAMPDGRVHHLLQGWEFHQGAAVGNAAGVFNPAWRNLSRIYPGTTATSTTSFPVTPTVAGQSSKSYTEYNLFYSEPGTVNSIQTRISLQP